MMSHIKYIFIMLLFFIFLGTETFSIVYKTNLGPFQTIYSNPYKIKNNTSNTIFAPFSDISGKITNNFNGGSSISFGTPLSSSYTQGGFTISNASYSWVVGTRGSCSVTCGGGTKSRVVSCRREDGSYVSDLYCSGIKPSTITSCNTQSCGTCGSGVFTCFSGSAGNKRWHDDSGFGPPIYISCSQTNPYNCSGTTIDTYCSSPTGCRASWKCGSAYCGGTTSNQGYFCNGIICLPLTTCPGPAPGPC